MKIEVKKNGEVTILHFRKYDYTPKRKPSVKRFLNKIKGIIPCRAESITADSLEDLILKTFGSDYQYHVLISDEEFRVITKEQMEQLLKGDDTDSLPYLDTYADCDDFSDVLLGSLTKKTWNQGYAIGQLWYYNPKFGHAVNTFCDGSKIWVVEPQSDLITEWGVEDYYGKAFMVKF